MDGDKLLEERKEKISAFFKKDINWVVYAVLAVIVWISVRIRSINLPALRDKTTGGWTLGPDLDPFLFLRWAKHIIENGSLMAFDAMRYVPLGYETKGELILLPYLIAWFHKIASSFGVDSIEHSAALFPIFMFALTAIAFFFLVKVIFIDVLGEKKANLVALLSTFFLSVIPAILPRTIGGIPEKESAGFLFLFLAFYFFLASWRSEKNTFRYISALLAGISTACMALIWGGYVYIFATIGITVFFAFLFDKIRKKEFYTYLIWMMSSVILIQPFTTRYPLKDMVLSVTTGTSFIVLGIIIINFVLFNTKLRKYTESIQLFSKIPKQIISIIFGLFIGIIAILIFAGPSFLASNINSIYHNLVNPITDRLGVTVAENRQPHFPEWSSSFGPIVSGIPIFFWLFFVGSVYLFYSMIKELNIKHRIFLTISYLFFLTAVIFSRYKPESIFNGENTISLFFYFSGFAVFLINLGYYYYQYYKKGEVEKFNSINVGLLLLFSFFFLSIISARGAVRIIMILVPTASIIASYLAVVGTYEARKVNDEILKMSVWIMIGIILLSTAYSGYTFYSSSKNIAGGYVPSVYTQQWQEAMSWVRENVSKNAVFGHWWDYGYWVQSIGERATVLDGGNAISYWDHLMGRHALTSPDESDALEFLYAHNTTHFLIDSTDIGKYGAFSSIGGDENHDRTSIIAAFFKDNSQTKEDKNSTLFLYAGGVGLDEDMIYDYNDTKITLPGGKAAIGALILKYNNEGNLSSQPYGIFVYQNKQFNLPLRYAFHNGFYDYGSGLEAGVFVMPKLSSNSEIDFNGALFYLSPRTVKSQLARIYLYGEEEHFNLVHTEDDYLIKQLRSQYSNITSFVYSDLPNYGGFKGPIKIWEINYPDGIEINKEYLKTVYPNEALRIST
ncbi:MAG: STT3 domain-containing protein [Nanoarchaeota archaeon]